MLERGICSSRLLECLPSSCSTASPSPIRTPEGQKKRAPSATFLYPHGRKGLPTNDFLPSALSTSWGAGKRGASSTQLRSTKATLLGAMGEDVSCRGRERAKETLARLCKHARTSGSRAAAAELRALRRTLLPTWRLDCELAWQVEDRDGDWQEPLCARVGPGLFPSSISFNSHDSPARQGLPKVKRSPRDLSKFTRPEGGCLNPVRPTSDSLPSPPSPLPGRGSGGGSPVTRVQVRGSARLGFSPYSALQ